MDKENYLEIAQIAVKAIDSKRGDDIDQLTNIQLLVDSMRRIGNQLPASLKETSCGGLAITESAQNYLNQSF